MSTTDKSFEDLLNESDDQEAVESALKLLPDEALKLTPTAKELSEIESCVNIGTKILKIMEIVSRKRSSMKSSEANFIVAQTMSKMQEDNKISRWDFRKFEPQEEEIFRSGEFRIWIRDLNDYCKSESFNDEVKHKALLHKSGNFLQKLISSIKTTKPCAFDNFQNSVAAITDELTPPGVKGLIDLTFRSCEPKSGDSRYSYLTRLNTWSTYVEFANDNERATAILNTAMQKISCDKLKSDIYKYGFIEKKDNMLSVVKQITNIAKIYDSEKQNVVKKVEKRQAAESDASDSENESKVMNVQRKKPRPSRDNDRKSDSRLDAIERSINLLLEQQSSDRQGPSRNLVRPVCPTCNSKHFGKCWKTMKCLKCHKFGHIAQNCYGRYRERSRSPAQRRDYKYERRDDNSKFGRSRKLVMKTEEKEKKDEEVKDSTCSTSRKRSSPYENFEIAGKAFEFFIDSGLDKRLNLVKLETLEEIKQAAKENKKEIKILDISVSAPLVFAYSHPDKPLEILGGIEVQIAPTKNPKLIVSAKIYAVAEAQEDLIGLRTAEKLHCIQIGYRDRAPERVYHLKITENDIKPFPTFPHFELQLDIDTSVAPKFRNFFIVPKGCEEKTKTKLNKLLNSEIISRLQYPGSAWVSPLLVIEKPNGDIRLCVDLTEVNKAVRRNFTHPMPTLRQMIDFSKGKNLFAKIDLRQAFYHIKLHKNSRYLTTFKSPEGYFCFNRVPFGLHIAPEVFQSLLESTLSHHKNVKVYLDDIIIAAENQEELEKTFNEVMQSLEDNNFEVNEDKIVKNVSEIEFVGFKLSKHGVKLTDDRVKSIISMRAPDNLKILKSFLGKINFLNSFLPRLSDVAAPMWRIARSETFEWGDEQQISYEEVKKLIASNEGRKHFESGLPTYLVTDAGPEAISAVLLQIDHSNGKRDVRVVEYASKLLTKTQRNYPHFQKEILAIVSAAKHFRHYLLSQKFTILTDLKTAGSIIQKSLSGHSREVKRHDKWMMDLREFSYDIKHLPGCLNIADALSRLATESTMHEVVDELVEKDEHDGEEHEKYWTAKRMSEQKQSCVVCNIIAKEKWSISCNEVKTETENDSEVQKVIHHLKNNEEHVIDKKWKHEKLKLWLSDDGLLIKGHMIVLPRTLRLRAIRIAHKTHMGKEKTVALLKQYVFWPGMTADVENLSLIVKIAKS